MNRKFYALVALLPILMNSPVWAERDGDVEIKRNPDGTIETFEAGQGGGDSGSPAGMSGGYKPVHSYTKKTSDGIHFKRNPDGSIETWEDDEPMPRSHSGGGGGGSKSKKKSQAKKAAPKSASGQPKNAPAAPKAAAATQKTLTKSPAKKAK